MRKLRNEQWALLGSTGAEVKGYRSIHMVVKVIPAYFGCFSTMKLSYTLTTIVSQELTCDSFLKIFKNVMKER